MRFKSSARSNTVDFVIFGAMRFGSNLLQEKLNYFQDIICLGELYNPTFVGVDRPHLDKYRYAGYGRNDEESRKRRMKDPFLLLEKVSDRAYEQKKILGFRIFNGHNHSVRRVLINDTRVKKIILTRNLIDSYVSLQLARESGQWVKREEKPREKRKIIFEIQDFEEYVQQNVNFFTKIIERLEETGQMYRMIDYEDVLDDGKVSELARYLGSKKKMNTSQTVLRKQNSASLADKIENFKDVREYLEKFEQPVLGRKG